MAMLAQSYKDKRVHYPCIVQPKLDGVRVLAYVTTDEDGNKQVQLISRQSKQFTSLKHIEDDLKLFEDGVYDGELYTHDLQFNELSGIVRLKEYQPERSNKIRLVLYDTVSTLGYSDRSIKLQNVFNEVYSTFHSTSNKITTSHNDLSVSVIDSKTINSKEDLAKVHQEYLSAGYEGTMVRTKVYNKVSKSYEELTYEDDKRSFSLLKFKDFLDDDFKIVGIYEEFDLAGNPKGIAAGFYLVNSDGKQFSASGFKHSFKTEVFNNPQDYIGKTAIVKYFELSPDGIPRFPNFVGIRAD